MTNLSGATTAVFIVSLSAALEVPVTVAWKTKDGTAKAGTDYEAASGSITFELGETTKQIQVAVYGRAEGDTETRTFSIELYPPENAILDQTLTEVDILVTDESGTAVTSLVVATGPRGVKGDPGLSAYELAKLQGYTGTLEEWIQTETAAGLSADRAESEADRAESAADAAAVDAANQVRDSLIPLGRLYATLPVAQADIANIPVNAAVFVRNTTDAKIADEYINTAGTLTPTGRQISSFTTLRRTNILFDAFNEYSSGNLVFGGWDWYKGYTPTFSSSDGDLPLPTPVIQVSGVFSVDKYYDLKRLPVKVGDNLTVSVLAWFQQAAGKFHITWLNSAGSLISTVSKTNLAAGVVTPAITALVPAGAVSFRLRVENTVAGSFKIGAYAAAVGEIQPEFTRGVADRTQTILMVREATASLESRLVTLQDVVSVAVTQNVTIQNGKFIDKSTGALSDNAALQCTIFDHTDGDAWKVTARVTGTSVCLAVYYNAAGAVIGREYDGTNDVVDLTDYRLNVPAGTAKIGITSRPFVPIVVKKLQYILSSNLQNAVNSLDIRVGKVESAFTYRFNPNEVAIQTDHYINKSNGSVVALAGFECTIFDHADGDRWQVTARVNGTGVCLAVYYNSSDSVIGTEYDGTAEAVDLTDYELTVPDGTAKIGITSRTIVPIVVKKREILTTDQLEARVSALETKSWAGKTIDQLGDSNIAMWRWQQFTIQNLGCQMLNHGVGGSKVAKPDSAPTQVSMCDDARINALSPTADAYTVLGGTNDWAQSIPLGTIADTVDTTFYGAYKIVIQKILTLYPGKPLFLMTPFFTQYTGPRNGSWADGLTNAQGLKVADYAEAVRQLGKRYGLPVIDHYALNGWNEFNVTNFLVQEDSSTTGVYAYIHMNTDAGAKRMADRFSDVVIGLRNFSYS